MASDDSNLEITCPCCGAKLTVDVRLRTVVAHEAPRKAKPAADLDHAGDLLRDQAARREEIFRRSSEEERNKTDILDRKFEEALKKSRGQPVERPTRDIDL